MNILEGKIRRRSLLTAGVAAGLMWLGRPLLGRPARAQQAAPAIIASPVSQAPTDPYDPLWARTNPALVALEPQNLVLPRLEEAGAKRIDVRALYDDERLAFLLEWKDAHKDTELGTVMQYRDAVAIQFPENPADGPRSHMMGQRGRGVTIYHWKSDWQFAQLHDVDEAYPNMYADWYQYSGVEAGVIPEASDYMTRGRKEYLTAAAAGNALADPQAQQTLGPIQKMRAEGFGTIEPADPQDARGAGVWNGGDWRIVISIPRQQPKFTLAEGMEIPFGFAVWDGSRNERNGQKAFSQWKTTLLGTELPGAVPFTPPGRREKGGGILAPVLGGVGGAVALVLAVLIGLRLRRPKSEERE
jgi:hypothetical protein